MQDIRPYEALAKLNLPAAERERLTSQAAMLTESFKEIESIDTEGIEPLITVLSMTNVLREDKAVKMLPREEILAQSPEEYDGYFSVPRTLE